MPVDDHGYAVRMCLWMLKCVDFFAYTTLIACSHPPWRSVCSVSVKKTLSGLSSSDKEDADVLSVVVLFQVHALHAKQQQAIVQ